MARAAWEYDAELEAAGMRARPKGRARAIFTWLLLVGAATFIGAYYVPLVRTHAGLNELYTEATARLKASEAKRQGLESDLRAAAARRDELDAEQKRRTAEESARRGSLDELATSIGASLKAHTDGARASVRAGDERVA